VKYGKDKQSEVQQEVSGKHRAAGGTYFIARNFDEFMIFYYNFPCRYKIIDYLC
jgi:hypothetical protein